jgi:hypothetical protein
VVSHPPEQAPPMVPGRRPGRAVSSWRRPSSPRPMVGSDGGTPHGDAIR